MVIQCPRCGKPARDTGHGMGHCPACNQYFPLSNPAAESKGSFADHLANVTKILRFDERALHDVANDPRATNYGLLVLFLLGAAASISEIELGFGGILAPIIGGIIGILGFFVANGIYHFLAKFVFKGKATGVQYFRVLSNCSIIVSLDFLPLIDPYFEIITAVWLLVLNGFIFHKLFGLSKLKAVLLLLLPFLVYLVLIFLGVVSFWWAAGEVGELQEEAAGQIGATLGNLGRQLRIDTATCQNTDFTFVLRNTGSTTLDYGGINAEFYDEDGDEDGWVTRCGEAGSLEPGSLVVCAGKNPVLATGGNHPGYISLVDEAGDEIAGTFATVEC